MGLDTPGSDHDIFLCVDDGDEGMVQLIYEVILDLQQQADTHPRLKRATVQCKDFAVEITGYYRDREFDFVPYIRRDDGEFQWDPQREVWQPLLHKGLTPHLQGLSQQDPEGYLLARLLKIWNESLPRIRNGKAPFISVHLPLLSLAARDHGYFEGCRNLQEYLSASLRFIEENWCRAEVGTQDTTWCDVKAQPHLERMTKKYHEAKLETKLPDLLRAKKEILAQALRIQENDRCAADRVLLLTRSFLAVDSVATRSGEER